MVSIHLSQSGGAVSACKDDEACEVISCEICLSEIPESVIHSAEGPDYVHHFCGLECLHVWHAKIAEAANAENNIESP